jgi:hypothetical protein
VKKLQLGGALIAVVRTEVHRAHFASWKLHENHFWFERDTELRDVSENVTGLHGPVLLRAPSAYARVDAAVKCNRPIACRPDASDALTGKRGFDLACVVVLNVRTRSRGLPWELVR